MWFRFGRGSRHNYRAVAKRRWAAQTEKTGSGVNISGFFRCSTDGGAASPCQTLARTCT
jgi:hypothetical protein